MKFTLLVFALTLSASVMAEIKVQHSYQFSDPAAFAAPKFKCSGNIFHPMLDVADPSRDDSGKMTFGGYLSTSYAFADAKDCNIAKEIFSKAKKDNVIEITVQEEETGIGYPIQGRVLNIRTIYSE